MWKVPTNLVLYVTVVMENSTKKEQKHKMYTSITDKVLKEADNRD